MVRKEAFTLSETFQIKKIFFRTYLTVCLKAEKHPPTYKYKYQNPAGNRTGALPRNK